jgi:LPXTG-site transpeptidase (sortase) family protein
MGKSIEFAARLIQAGKRGYIRKWLFLAVSVVVFLVSVVALAWLDLLPEASTTLAVSASPGIVPTTTTPEPIIAELPTKIAIPAIGLSANVANPTTTDVEVLDNALLKGAVRYPTSAKLGEEGNVVLFGHSSYLPIVGNRSYKIFNGIQKLVKGDIVTVYSAGTAYTYRVKSVARESTNNAAIPLLVAGRVLTLATCDSFASKSDRFVVVADFVESHSIST